MSGDGEGPKGGKKPDNRPRYPDGRLIPPNVGKGRKKGVKTARTKLIEAMAAERGVDGAVPRLAPTDIMYDNMMHHHQKARDTYERVLDRIRRLPSPESVGNAQEAAAYVKQLNSALGLFKEGQIFRELSQKCAAELAPYMHPRIAVVQLRTVDPLQKKTQLQVNFATTAEVEANIAAVMMALDEDEAVPPLAEAAE